MGKKIADLLIKLGADTYGFTKMRSDVKKQLDGLGKDLQGFGKSMSLYFTAPLTAAAGGAVHLADVQIRAEAKVQQAIKATGGAAKLNFEQLKKYASELQGKTVFGDEQILNESTAQLLTFTNIAGDNFKRVQQAALDVATVLDGDLKSTTIQLGKALNDPVKNLSALSRSGIQFSKDQVALIKSLAETNRLADAQTIILNELNRQYGGQAEAAAKVGLGSLRQLKNSLGDLGEEMGMILMPVVQKVVEWFQNLVTWLQNLSPATKTTIVVVGGIVAAIGPLSIGLGSILKMLPAIRMGFLALASPVGVIALAIGAATTAIHGFNASVKQASLDRISKKAQQFINSGKSVDELKQMREAALVKNQKAAGDYQRALDWLDPFKSKSLAAYALNYSDNKKAKIRANAEIAISYENVTALDEAIKYLETTEPIQLLAGGDGGGKDALGLLGKLQQKLSELEEAKKAATNTYEIHNLNLAIKKVKEEIDGITNVGTRDGIAGNTNGMLTGVIKPLQFDPNAINPSDDVWHSAEDRFRKNMNGLGQGMQEAVIDFGTMINGFVQDLAISIGESLGNAIGGGELFDNPMAVFGKAVGQFLTSIGKQLIATSKIVATMKKALNTIWASPWAGIVVGIAAIAAGQALINSFSKRAEKGIALANGGLAFGPTMALVGDNRGAGYDPEVIAPLSKLRQYGLGRQAIEFVGGQFKLSGSDLLLSIRREDAKITYVNALS